MKNAKLMLLVLLGATHIASCGPSDGYDRYAAYESLKSNLRDPGSAQFSDEAEYEHAGWKAYCGAVNSKNGFGGYAGASRFVIFQKKDGGSAALVDAPGPIQPTIQDAISRACRTDPSMPFVPAS